jgi:predicted deacetylase
VAKHSSKQELVMMVVEMRELRVKMLLVQMPQFVLLQMPMAFAKMELVISLAKRDIQIATTTGQTVANTPVPPVHPLKS